MKFVSQAKGWLRAHPGPVGSLSGVRGVTDQVVLTYDDGPEPGGTDSILAALAEKGATATFFVLLGRTRRFPALLGEVVDAGHDIGLHGIDHRRLTHLPRLDVRILLRDGRDELEQQIGREVRWFRPPYGAQTLSTRYLAAAAGMVPVMWTSTMWDWRHTSHEERLASALQARSGSILLGHDGFAAAEDGADDGPPPVLDRGALARDVLSAFASRGLSGVSLAVALRAGRPEMTAWFQR